MSLPTEYFTLVTLATFAGLVAAVNVVVFFSKDWIKRLFGDAGVRPFAAVVAFVIQMFVLYAQGEFVLVKIGLAVLNAILVAVTSFGTHEIFKDPFAKSTRISNTNDSKITSVKIDTDIGNQAKSDAQNGS